jgi:hypothetical protein
MKSPGFFQRSDLTATLWAFRREFVIVGLFSMVANLLMLTPTIYMLQVYDRVMVSQSELTCWRCRSSPGAVRDHGVGRMAAFAGAGGRRRAL